MDIESLVDIVFVVERTSSLGAFINEVKVPYIVPTLEHFSQGPLEDREYLISDKHSTQYAVVLYGTAANLLEPACSTFGPYSSPQKVIELFERLPLVGGGMESHANLAEGFATAHVCFEDMKELRARYNGNNNTMESSLALQKHCILLCNSQPYSMPVMDCWKFAGKTVEQLSALFHERKINLSIIAPRKIPFLYKLFMKADGDQPLAAKSYAKSVRHLVLLKGYHLKERPQSPNSSNTNSIMSANQQNPMGAPPQQQQQQQQQQQSAQQVAQNAGMPMEVNHGVPQQQQQLQSSAMVGMNPNQSNNVVLNQQMMQQQTQQQQHQQFAQNHIQQNPNFTGQNNRWIFPPNQQHIRSQYMAGPSGSGGGGVAGPNAQTMSGQNPNSALISQLSAPPNQNINPMLTQQQQIRMQMLNQQQQQQLQQQLQQHQQQQQQQQQASMNTNMQSSGPGGSHVGGTSIGPPPNQASSSAMSQQQQNVNASQAAPPQSAPEQTGLRDKIWSGTLEWVEKTHNQPKITRTIQCTVCSNIKDGEPEIKAINWPSKMFMQLMPRQLVGNIGGQYFKDSKTVIFKPQPCEASEALIKSMTTLFAGCVHFSTPQNMPCDIKVLILLYTTDKNAFLGFIPNNQPTFVERLRKVIQQKQLMGMQQTGTQAGGNNQQQQQPQQQQQAQQQMQNPMAEQMQQQQQQQQQNTMPGNVMSAQQQQQQQQDVQQQQQQQQQQHYQYAAQQQQQQQMNMQQMTGPMGAQLSGNQMPGSDSMQHQQQQMAMMQQHQRMPMMVGGGGGGGGGTNNPQPQLTPQHAAALQQQQRMVRPMMSNNPGLRHLLQQQSTPGQQFRPQMGSIQQGVGTGMAMGPGMGPSSMGGGPGPGPNRPFDENNFEFM